MLCFADGQSQRLGATLTAGHLVETVGIEAEHVAWNPTVEPQVANIEVHAEHRVNRVWVNRGEGSGFELLFGRVEKRQHSVLLRLSIRQFDDAERGVVGILRQENHRAAERDLAVWVFESEHRGIAVAG